MDPNNIYENEVNAKQKMTIKKGPIMIVSLIILLILVVISNLYILKPNEYAVVRQFGEVVKVEDKEGLKFKAVNVKTLVYPGFPTDLGQPMSVLLTQCDGESLFEETIYEDRMRHIKHLNAMGANIKLFDRNAIITGKTNLTGRRVIATDLRAGAAMLVAGMIADGITIISNIEHILRGYENIVEKLSMVGGNVKIISED